MPSFDSPIGGKKFASQQLKEFDVPDESDYSDLPSSEPPRGMKKFNEADLRAFQAKLDRENERDPAEIEREIRQAKADRRAGRERLSDAARKRIELLIDMNRNTRTAEVEGNIYVLQTLKGKQMREAISAAAEFDGTVQSPFEIRRQLLGRSLVSVANVSVEQFIGSNSLEARFDFIDEMDDILLNRLYEEYLILVKETQTKFSIKPEAVAEVVEDLKK